MPELLRVPGAQSGTLLGYLVGLGLLRVVARQADPLARASWRDGPLELTSALEADELEDFLRKRWEPAPVVSPWNGGSGFFRGDNTAAFDAIEADDSPQLDAFRQAIAASRDVLQSVGVVTKPEPKDEKPRLLRELRARLPDAAIEWLDAAVVLLADGAAYPPVLGSGGNDGRYDVANNYAQAVAFARALGGSGDARAESAAALSAALWDRPAPLRKMSLAHLFRDASPVNSPAGESDALGNPWHLALAIEGTLTLAAGASRRLDDAGAGPAMVSPFTLRPTAAGYGSAVAGEKGKSELWLPLWSAPAMLAEIETLFREARMRVAGRAARTGLDAARAAGELGVARGVDRFQRFSILERAGLSNLAVPAGQVAVRARPSAKLLATIDQWLPRVLGYGSGDVPAAQREAIGALDRAAFAVAERGGVDAVRSLVVALGRVEAQFAIADERSRPRGLRPLRTEAAPWIAELDLGGSTEVRIALGFASASDLYAKDEPRLPAVRDYLHGTGVDERHVRGYGMLGKRKVPSRATTVDRLAALHERRHLDAARPGRAQLGFDRGLGVGLGDLARFVDNERDRRLDDRAVGALVDGLALLDFGGARLEPAGGPPLAHPLLGVLTLAFHDAREHDYRVGKGGAPLGESGRKPCRPLRGWLTKLRAGQVGAVVDDALLRLRLSGLDPIPQRGDLGLDGSLGPRLAATLLAPPRWADVARLRRQLTIEKEEDR